MLKSSPFQSQRISGGLGKNLQTPRNAELNLLQGLKGVSVAFVAVKQLMLLLAFSSSRTESAKRREHSHICPKDHNVLFYPVFSGRF